MRFLHVADLHGGLPRYAQAVAGPLGNSRLVEFEEVLGQLGDYAIEREVDALLVAGDVFDTRYLTNPMLRLWATFCARMADAGVEMHVIPGNHDGPATIGDELTHTHYWLKALHLPSVHVYTRPTIAQCDGYTLVAMPYPHRRAFDGMLKADLPEDRVIEAGRLTEDLIARYTREAVGSIESSRPLIFLGHLTVLGAKTASERLMRMEWDVAVSPDVFRAYDYVALGHIHRMQHVDPVLPDRTPRIWYPGSPVFIDFSESKNVKGFLLVNIEPDGLSVEALPSRPRPMARVKLEYLPQAGSEIANARLNIGDELRGKIVLLTITGSVRPPESWVTMIERQLAGAGVYYLKTELRIDAPVTLTTEATEAPIDLTDKRAALTRYLAEHDLPDDPYGVAGRELIDALE